MLLRRTSVSYRCGLVKILLEKLMLYMISEKNQQLFKGLLFLNDADSVQSLRRKWFWNCLSQSILPILLQVTTLSPLPKKFTRAEETIFRKCKIGIQSGKGRQNV